MQSQNTKSEHSWVRTFSRKYDFQFHCFAATVTGIHSPAMSLKVKLVVKKKSRLSKDTDLAKLGKSSSALSKVSQVLTVQVSNHHTELDPESVNG